MRYLKTYENLNKDIEVGDIVKYTKYNNHDGNNWSGYDKVIYIGEIEKINDGNSKYRFIVKYEFQYYKNVENYASDSGGTILFINKSELNRMKKLNDDEFNKIVIKYQTNKFNI
jgi:hypothetical protein